MLFVPRRISDLFVTLRVRLMLWITFVVTLMVVITMVTVRQVVLSRIQDEFDRDLRDISQPISQEKDALLHELEQKVPLQANRKWFVELYSFDRQFMWASPNAPQLPPMHFPAVPAQHFFDLGEYRVF